MWSPRRKELWWGDRFSLPQRKSFLQDALAKGRGIFLLALALIIYERSNFLGLLFKIDFSVRPDLGRGGLPEGQ